MKLEFFCSPEDDKIIAKIGDTFKEIKGDDVVITHLHEVIADKYPDTYNELNTLYPQDRYAQVSRFIRCNFAIHDKVLDIDDDLINLEYVFCPYRPYCPHNNLICNPHIANKLRVREMEIARLITKGFLIKEIASELFLSVKTIETYRTNIYKNLKIHSNTELATYMYSNKFL
jgi:DNA-binding CsgD family transcriptional regulator